ncbi:MAG: hypothetical protein ACRDQ4_05490 [Pseudonocardiaceae bacterium]
MNRRFGHGSAQHGIGYAWGAVILTSILAIVFLVWWRTGQTYNVKNIATRKTGLGFRNAFFIIAGIILVIVTAHYLTSINGMVLFWLTFILTRPLAAAGATR